MPSRGAKQSRDIATPVFNGHILTIIEANVDKIHIITGKQDTALCSFKGRLLDLLARGESKLELPPRDVNLVGKLSEFAVKFRECEYSQSELCIAMVSAFRVGKCVKELSDDTAYHNLFMKINDCKDAIDGLREFVFSLCCDIYKRIEGTTNVRKIQFFRELFSIWHCRCLEQATTARRLRVAHEEAAQAAETAERILSPVDLTDDFVPSDSESNSE